MCTLEQKPENLMKANNTRKPQPTLNKSNYGISEGLSFLFLCTSMEYKSKRILGTLLKIYYYNGIKVNS